MKNSGEILPLKPKVKSIAVIGPNAEGLAFPGGNYNGAPSKPVLPKEELKSIRQQSQRSALLLGSPFVKWNCPSPFRARPCTRSRSKVAGLQGEYFSIRL
ncbi:MAG: glycoside hydrolase family 3 C-terminal domain-containing protein [Terriglobia bacterium]